MKRKLFYIGPIAITLLFLGGQLYLWQTRGAAPGQKIRTVMTSFPTFEERCADASGQIQPCRQLEGLQAGDLLVTASAHTLFFRHGHIGVVVDAKEGLVLEALGLGQHAVFRDLGKWNDYPTLQILRPLLPVGDNFKKEALNLKGLPYFPFARRHSQNRVHCATLIWQLFYSLDVDLIGDQWVLPLNFSNSEHLKVIYSSW